MSRRFYELTIQSLQCLKIGNKFLSRIWNNAVEKLYEEGLLEKKLTIYEGTKHTTISESEYDTHTTQDASGHQSRKAHAHYDHKLEEKHLEVYRSFSTGVRLRIKQF